MARSNYTISYMKLYANAGKVEGRIQLPTGLASGQPWLASTYPDTLPDR